MKYPVSKMYGIMLNAYRTILCLLKLLVDEVCHGVELLLHLHLRCLQVLHRHLSV